MRTPSKINTLIHVMKTIETELARCTKCGMCMASCPLYKTTGRETDTARGKIAILSGIINGILSDGKKISERIDRCLLCGSCALKCPRGIHPHEIIIRARGILSEYNGLSPLEKILFRGFLTKPDRFDTLTGIGAKAQQLLLTRSGTPVEKEFQKCLGPFFPGRYLKPIAIDPFHARIKRTGFENTPLLTNGKTIRALFFTGCLIDKFYPETGFAACRVLAKTGVQVQIPEHQGCCGMPALASGDLASFKKLVYYHLSLFSPDNHDYIVSACPTCVFAIKHLWPLMMENEPMSIKEQIEAISQKTVDIHQLVYAFYKDRAISTPQKNTLPVTYHAPCHLKKSLGIDNEPQFLIRMNPGYRLIELNDGDACCGFGGSFNLKYYDISSRIGMGKRESILKTRAKKVVTGCPACMLQLEEIFHKNGDDISVVHTMEYLDLKP